MGEFRQDQLKTPYCLSLTDEVNALKDFVTAKENTRAKYIENLVTQKKAENKKAQDAAIAEADAMKEKHGMMAALSEQTDHDHQSRTNLAEQIEDQLTEYIGQDAKRAEADLKSAIEHATKSANTVEANSVARHTTLNAKHEDLSGKHAAFANKTTADVGAINAKFDDNDEDKERRHVKTLNDANEFTTEVETKLNARATGLQNMHDTTKKFILDRFGRKQEWDASCDKNFGKWANAPEQNVKAMSEGSSHDSVAKASPARRRLAANSTRGHTVVLEALLDEINRQN